MVEASIQAKSYPITVITEEIRTIKLLIFEQTTVPNG